MNKKVTIIALTCVLAALSLTQVYAGGGKDAAAGQDGKLVVWSFTDELDGMIRNYYEKDFPGKIKFEYSLTPTDQFQNKLDPVLASGTGTPDVFALEDAFVRKYIESGLLLDLTDVYNEVKDKLVDYPVQIGSYGGKVYGLSWQVAPGGFFYRRSLAKKYLGTDDPVQVQKAVSNFDRFVDTATVLNQKSNGNCYIVSAGDELVKPFLANRKKPWVVNGKLYIDPALDTYLELRKLLHDKGYEGRATQWAEGWFAGMKGEMKDERGTAKEVFGYFLPTWGLHYVLKTNAPNTSGDWAMCQGPVSWRWGGTRIAAYKGTKNPEAAKEFIKYIATNDDFLTRWAKDTGDVVSNKNVLNAVKDNFTEPYLGGQNHYAAFAKMAETVDGKLNQGTDQAIESLFLEASNAYINGEKTKSQALQEFKNQVETTLGL